MGDGGNSQKIGTEDHREEMSIVSKHEYMPNLTHIKIKANWGAVWPESRKGLTAYSVDRAAHSHTLKTLLVGAQNVHLLWREFGNM